MCLYAGVIPFIALSPPIAASLPLLPVELVQNAGLLQVAYGASICSFLGGIHWAMAMAEYGGSYLLKLLQACFKTSSTLVNLVQAWRMTFSIRRLRNVGNAVLLHPSQSSLDCSTAYGTAACTKDHDSPSYSVRS